MIDSPHGRLRSLPPRGADLAPDGLGLPGARRPRGPARRYRSQIFFSWLAIFLLFSGLVVSNYAIAQTETRPQWVDLSPGQQQLLAPFASQWNGWRPEEKRVWLSLYQRFPTLSAPDKLKARKRIEQWAGLKPRERAVARRNYRLAREKQRAERMAEWERYKQMTREQKSVLRRSGGAARTRSGLAPRPAKPFK